MSDVEPNASLRRRVRHLIRVEGLELPSAARRSLEDALLRRGDPSAIRADFGALTGCDGSAAALGRMLSDGHPHTEAPRRAGFDPNALLGVHELAQGFVGRTVQRCMMEDGVPRERTDQVCERVLDALSGDLARLQRQILAHARPDRIVHIGRFLTDLDLAPARRAYLAETGLEPAQSVVGYVEYALHGSDAERQGLVRWSVFSETHLVLVCGVSIPTTGVPESAMFSALELMERNTEPHAPMDSAARPWESPVVPAFFPSRARGLDFPLVDSMLISLARPVLGRERCTDVLVTPPQGPPPSVADVHEVRGALGPWVSVGADTLAPWLGARPESDVREAGWGLVWSRLLDGLRVLASHAGNRPRGFRTLVAAWLREGPLGRHPSTRHRGQEGRFDLNPVESALDQQLVRMLLRQGRHPRELLRWLLASWPEASEAVRSLAVHSGVDGSAVASILHGLEQTRSLGAEKKAVTLAGRQAWCLAEVDAVVASSSVGRVRAAQLARKLPAEPWASSRVVRQGRFDPQMLGWL